MISALETILHRPRTILTLMVVMIVAGIATYIAIPKEADPDIDVPVFYVSVVQQGISPEDADRLLVRPMETTLRSLDGLKELTAIASESHAGFVLEFDADFDKDKALADIRDKVDQGKAELPEEAEEPTITETNFALQPTIIITLSGDVPERTLYRHARRLKDELEAISSVRSADLSGHREEMFEVIIDMMKLESYDVTQQELLTALTNNNQLVPAGFLDTGKGRFNVKVPGLVETVQDVYQLPIKQNGEGVVTLGDIADIRYTFKDASQFTRVNGKPAIALLVVKRIGTNIIENNTAVRAVVEQASADWPSAIQVNYLLDKSTFIYEVLGSLQSSILTAIFLVMILVVAALGLRSALLVGLAIPASFMVGFLILGLAGFTVNMMVMFGLVLTVGMLVDGAIVVTEYADRKLAEGLDPEDAYIRASKLMFWPIVSSTATTLAAFLPMLLWPGVPGEFMSYLPIMVIIVLSASLVTAMVFLPASGIATARLVAWCGRHGRKLFPGTIALLVGFMAYNITSTNLGALSAQAGPALPVAAQSILPMVLLYVLPLALALVSILFALKLYDWRKARNADKPQHIDENARILSAKGHFDPKAVKGLTGVYVRFLNRAAGTLVGNVVVLAAVLGASFMVFYLFGSNNAGVEFFVDEEPDQAIVLVSGRGNLSALEADHLVAEVEQQVLQVPGVKNVVTTSHPVGGGGSGPELGGVQDKPADVIGELNVELASYCCRRRAVEVFADIRERTAKLAGIKVEVRKIEGGPPTGKDLRLQVTSTNYDLVAQVTGRIRAHVNTMDGLRDVEDSRPLPGIEWELAIDREEAGRFNAGIASVGAMVQLVTNGILIGTSRPDDSEDEVDIRVRLPEEQRTLDRFEQLKLRTPNGQVPIRNFVERKPQQKVSQIIRRDGLYAMDVKADVIEELGLTPDDKVNELDAWLKTQTWPENVFFKFRGADEEQKESGAFLMKAMLGSLFLMFIILVTQFNSFYQTFLTLSTVVMSVVGVLIGMMVTGQKFSIIMTGTGVVALAGIVVNNAIVLIDTYNRFRHDGMEPLEAILKTSAQRIRPILLTTITTIAGLVPMATQVNFNFFDQIVAVGGVTAIWWVQLSTAIISGLAFSTLLTLIVIPSMLAMPGNVARAFSSRKKKRDDDDQSDEADVHEEMGELVELKHAAE
ncbi:efflux RND transporter permease subunit [Coralliovum pocilloporae]|uniref:efflux RND transporter permease subunit n=1 Tax=Coralliovum pocilloporae TaxID=3066369 RepID=UPI00330758BA